MTHYTDEDRKKAATARERNQQFRQLLESPEDIYDIMGVSVPRVSNEPRLADYGVSDDTKDMLATLDKKSVSEKKATRRSIFWSVLLILSAVCAFYVGIGITIGILLGFLPFIFAFYALTDAKPEKTALHERYETYTRQKGYYDYWQRKKNKAHWNGMSGHGFEQAVANLFRHIGFTAEVSARGGDGGVDIILQKTDRRIAVQCKRYKSAVGPHVIRDLWGTMHALGFNEGCIVTTTGFTRGVNEFARDKKIHLVDLNDILRATNDGNDKYLLSKLNPALNGALP